MTYVLSWRLYNYHFYYLSARLTKKINMKKMFLLVMAIAAVSAYAQKVDLDRHNFNYKYRKLPSNPLDEGYKTYNFSIASSSSIKEVYNDDLVKSAVTIDGLKKVDEQGHITINISMGEVALRDPQVKEREEITKDKDGKETGRKKYYWIEATYTWNADATINDYKGNKLHRVIFASGEANTWTSSEYDNKAAPGDYYNNNRFSIRSGLASNLAGTAMKNLRSSLNNRYGYPAVSEHDILWVMDSKKHPEQDAMQNAWTQFKAAVTDMNASDSLAEFRTRTIPVIAYFDSLKTRFTGTEKADKKLRYSAYYCLAKIYLLLDNPDAAIKEAEGLIANDYDPKDGKYLKKEAEDMKALFEKNNIYTRHFPIDISKYTAPETK
jgi:hypothetical protein